MNKHYFITGSNGTVGKLVTQLLIQLGKPVLTVNRSPDSNSWSDSWSQLIRNLDDTANLTDLIVIHLAIPPQPRNRTVLEKYVLNTLELAVKVHAMGGEFWFVSSLSAHSGNPSLYAQHKKSLERKILDLGGNVLSLGLVTSGDSKSSFQRLKKLSKLFPSEVLSEKDASYYLTSQSSIRNWLQVRASALPLSGVYEICANTLSKNFNEVFPDNRPLTKIYSPFILVVVFLRIMIHRYNNLFFDPIVNLYYGSDSA